MNSSNLYPLIERIGNLLRTEIRTASNDLGLQPVHLQVLDYLSRCNRYSDTPIAVADYLGTTKGTMSQTLNVLKKKGYISKLADTDDKRVQHLKISQAGRDILATFIPPAAYQDAIDRISELDCNQMVTLLTRTLRELQIANACKTFGVCKSCHFFRSDGMQYQCGLTHEPLSDTDSEKICREHSPNAAMEPT